jgi:hypothetical protein
VSSPAIKVTFCISQTVDAHFVGRCWAFCIHYRIWGCCSTEVLFCSLLRYNTMLSGRWVPISAEVFCFPLQSRSHLIWGSGRVIKKGGDWFTGRRTGYQFHDQGQEWSRDRPVGAVVLEWATAQEQEERSVNNSPIAKHCEQYIAFCRARKEEWGNTVFKDHRREERVLFMTIDL